MNRIGENIILRSRFSEPTLGNRAGTNVIEEENLGEDDFELITAPAATSPSSHNNPLSSPTDVRTGTKAARVLGIQHVPSMTPVPAFGRKNSVVSTRSAREVLPATSHLPSLPLTSLYVVSGLPKSPHTWTLSDPDSVLGLHHSDGAVNRWWRPEVLGSTVSPGVGGASTGKKKRRGKDETKGAGALHKSEVGKMLSKALKVRPHHKFDR